eukprot:UN17153
MNLALNNIPGHLTNQFDNIIENLKPYLDRDVTFFGSTLIGKVKNNPLNLIVERNAEFTNSTKEHIKAILDRHFEEHTINITGYDPEYRGYGVVWSANRLRP